MNVIKIILGILLLGIIGSVVTIGVIFFTKTYPVISSVDNAVTDLSTQLDSNTDYKNKCIINKDNILNQIEDVYKKIDELNNYLFGSAFINVYKSRVDSIKRNININSNC